MQDPNEDTQWNDVLRAKGILPPKEEVRITEEDIVNMVEKTVQEKSHGKNFADMDQAELDDIEDDIDEEEERVFEQYRQQRIAEMKAKQMRARYGDVLEITKADYVQEVNKAGDGVWVVLHIYNQGIPLCSLINQYISQLAQKNPETKFIKSISSLCIPNYPDKNLPTIFIYYEGDMKKQWVGPHNFGGMNLKVEDLEWMLSQGGAIKTNMEENPRKQISDLMTTAIRSTNLDNDDSDDGY